MKICIANRKGGVSKTTTAVNVASIMVEKGYKVLLIDLDPQANATENLGINTDELDSTMYHVIAKNHPIIDAIQHTEFGVDIVPSSVDLAEAEIEVASKINREKILSNALDDHRLDYDFILFDLPPNLGLLSINGLVATDSIIITVDVGMFSLSGIGDLLEVVNLIRKSKLNERLDVLGVLMTKVDNRTNISKRMKEILTESVGDKVFKTQIRQNVKIAESQINQMPINHYDKASIGYIEYVKFVEEVLDNVESNKR